MFNPLKVYGRREILELLGLSQKTWERLESRNDIPVRDPGSPTTAFNSAATTSRRGSTSRVQDPAKDAA